MLLIIQMNLKWYTLAQLGYKISPIDNESVLTKSGYTPRQTPTSTPLNNLGE